MMTPYEYGFLIKSFLDQQISASVFENQYLNAFKSETELMDNRVHMVLERLFEAVDAYWYECSPDEETVFMISEASLRKEAQIALRTLETLLGLDFI